LQNTLFCRYKVQQNISRQTAVNLFYAGLIKKNFPDAILQQQKFHAFFIALLVVQVIIFTASPNCMYYYDRI
jgi:hypothetical protein